MRIWEWLASLPGRMRDEGIRRGTRRAAGDVQSFLLEALDRVDPRGRPVYEADWDALVVLDACRPDALAAVAAEYDFLPADPATARSPASCSRVWLDRTFTPDYADEMAGTAYVTGNPYSEKCLDPNDFGRLDEVWRYAWDDEAGTVPARPLTERAVAAGRETDCDRLIVHYMQPHFPSVPDPLGSGIDIETFGSGWNSVWDRLREGEVDREAVWNSYLENLRYVLDDVAVLRENLDADRVVVTADHGNAFGEWGLYGHPERTPVGALRDVPWAETTAVDERSLDPELSEPTERADPNVEDRLANLGYR